jgi:hypothetical protein
MLAPRRERPTLRPKRFSRLRCSNWSKIKRSSMNSFQVRSVMRNWWADVKASLGSWSLKTTLRMKTLTWSGPLSPKTQHEQINFIKSWRSWLTCLTPTRSYTLLTKSLTSLSTGWLARTSNYFKNSQSRVAHRKPQSSTERKSWLLYGGTYFMKFKRLQVIPKDSSMSKLPIKLPKFSLRFWSPATTP